MPLWCCNFEKSDEMAISQTKFPIDKCNSSENIEAKKCQILLALEKRKVDSDFRRVEDELYSISRKRMAIP